MLYIFVLGCVNFLIYVQQNSTYPDADYTDRPGLEWPRGFQEDKVPRFHDNGTGWW